MREKRKRGSTLITVLAVSLIFMSLSGVILKSISSTMKSNINQKDREDLRYAAESGLEIARSYFKEGNISIDTRDDSSNMKPNVTQKEKDLDNILSNGIVDKVDIYMDIEDGKEIVKSIAKHVNGKSQEIAMVNYSKKSSNNINIFEYGIVAGEGGIEINHNGDLNGSDTSISSGKPINSEGSGSIKVGKVEPNSIGKIDFINWSKKENKIIYKIDGTFKKEKSINLFDDVPITKIKMNMNSKFNNPNWEIGKLSVNGSNKEPVDYLKNINKEPVVIIEIEGLAIQYNMTIIIVNSDELIIESLSSRDINHTAIINKGVVTIGNLNQSQGALKLNQSTIFAEKIIINENSSLHLTFQPAKTDDEEMIGILEEEETKQLNKLFEGIISNWNNEVKPGAINSPIIEIEKGTFSN